MDLTILKNVLNSNSVPKINRTAGTTFSIDIPIERVKTEIIEHACKHNNVILCESVEDQILAIVESKPIYTAKQEELINLLQTHGYSAIAGQPDIKEDDSKLVRESRKILSESADRTLDATEIHKEIQESDEIDNFASKVIEKLQMCPDFSSLMFLEEDFNNVGLAIHKSNNSNVMLCTISEDGKPQNDKIFENYMIIGSEKTSNIMLTDRFVECIVKFVKKVASTSNVVKSDTPDWQKNVASYGYAIGSDSIGATKQ